MAVRVTVSTPAVRPPVVRSRSGPRLATRALKALVARAVHATLAAFDIAEADVSVALLDDDEIAALNARYLERQGPTDVLAFALYGPGEAPVGDVYVGFAHALRQAHELGVPPDEELARLAIHGTLHVLGHDHPEGPGRQRSAMWRMQERILAEVMQA